MLAIKSLKDREEVLALVDSNDIEALERRLEQSIYSTIHYRGSYEDRIILKHAVTTGKSATVRVLTRKIAPGNDIMCLAIEDSGKEVIEALMNATGSAYAYADEDIRLSILRALERERIEEAKMVVDNYRVRFGYRDIRHLSMSSTLDIVSYAVSISSSIEHTLREMIRNKEYRGSIAIVESLLLNGTKMDTITGMMGRCDLDPVMVKYYLGLLFSFGSESAGKLDTILEEVSSITAAHLLVEKGAKLPRGKPYHCRPGGELERYYMDMELIKDDTPNSEITLSLGSTLSALVSKYL